MKKKILILMGRYLPGFKDGGPVRTILNLVDVLHKDYDFKIVTNDRDHKDTKAYPDIVPHAWNQVGNAMVYYVPPQGFKFSLLLSLAKDADIIYCLGPYNNYSYKTLILKKVKLIKKPVIIGAMGSFSPAAYQIKGVKKRVFIKLCTFMGLFTAASWSVTSTIEKQEVQDIIGKQAKCYIAEDVPRRVPDGIKAKEKEAGTLNIVFISRISKIKNLDYAIRIVSKLKGSINFSIYGNPEDVNYWNKCMHLLHALPDNVFWKYEGEAASARIIEIFSQYHIFLFPTLGENYGHVIHEALSAGCIPVISNTTPWQGFDEKQCGNVIPLHDLDVFVDKLQTYVSMNRDHLDRLSKNANAYAREKYEEVWSTNGYRDMFSSI